MMRESHKLPEFLCNHPVTAVGPNTQQSQVACLLFPKKVMDMGVTTYEGDYVKYSINSRLKRTMVPQTNITAGPRETGGTTTYREMINPVIRAIRRHEVQRTFPLKPIERKLSIAVAGSSSEYRDAFRKKPLVLELHVKPAARINTIPFRGTTTMKSDFKFIKQNPSASKPNEKIGVTPESRNFRTTYHSYYKKPLYPLPSAFATYIRPWTSKCD
ncbi:hypothetical protein TraAM80_09371 [Trypanosoma rangeli]|uniref:Uncharacterized protein n=1 Tax=Trypanosoma rangeli TaxID=5698 RepID=A0A422MVX2_TRYRA|nr:uncharacterized protein TraAM80_09371 [Trypanosoma rangeli]RNE97339.1 hypothetical protein TraAM80_09371 [Trypanosoma rangeli]|eukprot:RNE97339.1 hypothetical protein TraAM80_09371 [Trypanosoma rangeli]